VRFDTDDAGGLLERDTISSMLELPFQASIDTGYGRGWMTERMFLNAGHTVGWLIDPDDGLDVHAHSGGGGGLHPCGGLRRHLRRDVERSCRGTSTPEIAVWPADLWESVIPRTPVGSPPVVERSSPTRGGGDSVWR
jgi:hypothetical protein